MVPCKWIGVDHFGEKHVRGGQQGEWEPEGTAWPASAKKQQRSSYGSERPRVRYETRRNREHHEQISQHESPRPFDFRGLTGWRQVWAEGAAHIEVKCIRHFAQSSGGLCARGPIASPTMRKLLSSFTEADNMLFRRKLRYPKRRSWK